MHCKNILSRITPVPPTGSAVPYDYYLDMDLDPSGSALFAVEDEVLFGSYAPSAGFRVG